MQYSLIGRDSGDADGDIGWKIRRGTAGELERADLGRAGAPGATIPLAVPGSRRAGSPVSCL